MVKQVHIAEDPLDVSKWRTHVVEGPVLDFIMAQWAEWPPTARIYHETVSVQTDITPTCEADFERINAMEGPFFVVIYPGDPISIVVAIVIAVAVVAVAYFLAPKIPTAIANRNIQDSSPNNQLGNRTNTVRINERIPDIFGQVRAVPDLISVPYRVYRNHQEVEISYMCLGKGYYEVEDIRDGETLIADIAGTTAEVYAPFTSPNSGDDPQIRIGTEITEPVAKVTELASVNGQTLRAPNANSVSGNANIRFEYPDTIHVQSSAGIDFTDFFEASDTLVVSNAAYTGPVEAFVKNNISVRFTYSGTIVFASGDPRLDFQAGDTLTLADASRTDGVNPVNLAGTYTIASVSATTITLSSPASVNTDWNILDNWTGDQTGFGDSDVGVSAGTRSGDLNGTYSVLSVGSNNIALASPSTVNANWEKIDQLTDEMTPYGSPILQTSGPKWIGPFFLNVPDLATVNANFIALNGLFKDDGRQQLRFDVTVRVELTPCSANGTPTGSPEIFDLALEGSATSRDARAGTLAITPSFTGYCLIRAQRLTPADLAFEGSVIDEVKWQKVYAFSPIAETDFGNVTTVYTRTYATSGALSIKERKLNMLATRQIPVRDSGDEFTDDLYSTKSADEILSFICLDPYIGNRQKSEIDFNSIYETVAAIKAYFGDDAAGEFSYTFDNSNLSFEETIASITEAIFCTGYRQGNRIKLYFDCVTEGSTMLFNHRNKLPGTETRTVAFGNKNDYDGVEVEYVNPETEFTETYYIPPDRSAVNPMHVQTVGVRSFQQAFWQAWRTWNRVRYQNIATVFDATQEAAALVNKQRILVADNTRSGTQDGEVYAQNGLTLTLSQEIEFEDGESYIIFLQHVDATIESIPIVAGAEPNEVVLQRAPAAPLALNPNLYARATYMITTVGNTEPTAFLLTEKEPQDRFTSRLTAVNYTPLYYQHDRLELWLPFFESSYKDYAPYEYDLAAVGSATVVNDTTRGPSHNGVSAASLVNITGITAPAAYTKMVWLKKTDLSSVGHLLSDSSGTDEQFYVNVSGQVVGAHTGAAYVGVALPSAGVWHHVALSFDPETGLMALFVNGEVVDTAEDVPQRSLGGLTAFGGNAIGGLIGRAQDLRLYSKALSANEIKAIYRASVVV